MLAPCFQIGEFRIVHLEDFLGPVIGPIAQIATTTNDQVGLSGQLLIKSPIPVIDYILRNHHSSITGAGNGNADIQTSYKVAVLKCCTRYPAILPELMAQIRPFERLLSGRQRVKLRNVVHQFPAYCCSEQISYPSGCRALQHDSACRRMLFHISEQQILLILIDLLCKIEYLLLS